MWGKNRHEEELSSNYKINYNMLFFYEKLFRPLMMTNPALSSCLFKSKHISNNFRNQDFQSCKNAGPLFVINQDKIYLML